MSFEFPQLKSDAVYCSQQYNTVDTSKQVLYNIIILVKLQGSIVLILFISIKEQ